MYTDMYTIRQKYNIDQDREWQDLPVYLVNLINLMIEQ